MSHKIDYSLSLTSVYVPEKGLLAGILELAVRDLSSCVGNWSLRKEAFKWILSKRSESKLSFTFKTVVTSLDLTDSQINYIINKALKSKEEYKAFRDRTFSNIREMNGRVESSPEEKEETEEEGKWESQRRESRTGICNSPGRPGDALSSKVLAVQC
jgi:hypothetical protein